jgi:hypothetical protein
LDNNVERGEMGDQAARTDAQRVTVRDNANVAHRWKQERLPELRIIGQQPAGAHDRGRLRRNGNGGAGRVLQRGESAGMVEVRVRVEK